MKSLELNTMETLQGGNDYAIGFFCGLTILAVVGLAVGTAGVGAGIGGVIAVNACGAAVGSSLANH